MSSNNNLTRDAYYNYGSYLRSRGYDQYLQRLVEALEAGEIPIGGVSPGQPGLGATVTGNLNVNSMRLTCLLAPLREVRAG